MSKIDVDFYIVFIVLGSVGDPFWVGVDALGGLWSAQAIPKTVLEPYFLSKTSFSLTPSSGFKIKVLEN